VVLLGKFPIKIFFGLRIPWGGFFRGFSPTDGVERVEMSWSTMTVASSSMRLSDSEEEDERMMGVEIVGRK